ncbi:hypothetical protein [Nitrosomonas supralitoralis]|uniref:Uncharacterized protein n=1 Tax=Nitrosomonas supralitoralis TaxID=2116706 RepID=A0A2P7NT02_9PROT|nr:hypothetical protein [Nitrosomonas supralitoralis]PSJ16603.1 hypothetical protein C7H79_12665 [Nitrosomonas supralitoralis]
MIKRILAYECILIALFMLPSAIFAAETSKSRSTKETIPIELQRGQSQQVTPQKTERIKFSDEALSRQTTDTSLIRMNIKAKLIETKTNFDTVLDVRACKANLANYFKIRGV